MHVYSTLLSIKIKCFNIINYSSYHVVRMI